MAARTAVDCDTPNHASFDGPNESKEEKECKTASTAPPRSRSLGYQRRLLLISPTRSKMLSRSSRILYRSAIGGSKGNASLSDFANGLRDDLDKIGDRLGNSSSQKNDGVKCKDRFNTTDCIKKSGDGANDDISPANSGNVSAVPALGQVTGGVNLGTDKAQRFIPLNGETGIDEQSKNAAEAGPEPGEQATDAADATDGLGTVESTARSVANPEVAKATSAVAREEAKKP